MEESFNMSNFTKLSDSDGSNDTAQSYENKGYLFFSPSFNVFITTALVAVIVVAIIGNILVCIAMFWNPNLRKATTSLFLISLAVSDLLTASLVIPFDVNIIQKNGLWFHGEVACKIWTTAYLLTVPTSNLTLLILSIDRYLTLRKPLSQFRRDHIMTRKNIFVCMGALWAYLLVWALLPMTGWKLWRLLPRSVNSGICIFNVSNLYSILVSALHFIFPALAMCIIYVLIYRQIWKHTRSIHPNGTPVPAQTSQARLALQRNIRAAKRIAVIVSVFLLCWVPYSVLSITSNFCFDCFLKIPQEVLYVTLMMGYSNSALNPILYSFNNRNFIDSYKRLYRGMRKTLTGRAK